MLANDVNKEVIMPRDKTENHQKIMVAAYEEFMEFGFMKSSMRHIGKRCGLTASGIYRHCIDKEDLFAQVVAPAIDRINHWLDAHVNYYLEAVQRKENLYWRDSEIDMMREIIYPHMDEYYLLLVKSQGSRYDHFLNDLIIKNQKQLLSYLPVLKEQGYAPWNVDEKSLHLLLSAYMTSLFEPVLHRYSLDEALHCLKIVEEFFLPSWKKLLGFK